MSTWQVDIRLLPVSYREKGKVVTGPPLLMVVDVDSGLVLFGEAFPPLTPVSEMVAPMVRNLASRAPAVLQVRNPDLVAPLSGAFPPPTAVTITRQLGQLDAVAAELEQSLGGTDPVAYWRGLEASYPDLGQLMEAAARYYRLKPWQRLADDDVVALQIGSHQYFVSVLGGAGTTYGVAMVTGEGRLRQLLAAERPEAMPDSISVVFDDGEELGSQLRARLRQRYDIAARHAFPTFMAWRKRRSGPPNGKELQRLGLAMGVMPELMRRLDSGQTEVDMVATTTLGDRTLSVEVHYPVL